MKLDPQKAALLTLDLQKGVFGLVPGSERVMPIAAKVVAAVKAASGSHDWKKEAGNFVLYPAKWLSRRGWEDSVQPVGLQYLPGYEPPTPPVQLPPSGPAWIWSLFAESRARRELEEEEQAAPSSFEPVMDGDPSQPF